VHVTASVDRDKDKLVVLDVMLQHSHDTNPLVASTHPEKCRLDDTAQKVCATLLDLGVAAKKLKNMQKHRDVADVFIFENEALVSFGDSGPHAVDIEKMLCNCTFHATTRLPCAHILMYRLSAGKPLLTANSAAALDEESFGCCSWQQCSMSNIGHANTLRCTRRHPIKI